MRQRGKTHNFIISLVASMCLVSVIGCIGAVIAFLFEHYCSLQIQWYSLIFGMVLQAVIYVVVSDVFNSDK